MMFQWMDIIGFNNRWEHKDLVFTLFFVGNCIGRCGSASSSDMCKCCTPFFQKRARRD